MKISKISRIQWLLTGFLLVLLGSLVSTISLAQSVSSAGDLSQIATNAVAPAVTPIQDCSAGCYIMTCNKDWCTVWYCSAQSGCVKAGAFMRNMPPSTQTRGLVTSSDAADQVTFAKTCQTATLCNVYAFDNDGMRQIGTFDNIEGAVQRYRAEHHLR